MDRQTCIAVGAWIAIVANTAWVLAVAYLHLVERGLQPSTRYVSEYVLTKSGWLMEAAFASLALGALSLAAAFALSGSRGLPVALAVAAFGISMGIAGWFPTDPSTGVGPLTAVGEIHNEAARRAYLSIVAAALLGVAAGLLRVHPFERLDWSWLLVSGAVIVGYLLTRYGWRYADVGIVQRIFLTFVVAWLTLAALRLIAARGA